jgi:hypothetical protein
MNDSGKPLRLDPKARSANPAHPAFVARPPGASVYHGFPLIEATNTDGWVYGAITDFEAPEGAEAGDGYVQAPDGRRAGLVWEFGEGEFAEILPPDKDRWGVYAVWFPKPVHSVSDLTDCFRHVLPALRKVHARMVGGADA